MMEKMEESGFVQRWAHPSNKWRKMLLLLLLTGWTWTPIIHGELFDTEGPQFTQEPVRYNYFTNRQGLLLHCNAKGTPTPEVRWIGQSDGQPVQTVSGIREIFTNGSIYFPPFPVTFYRSDVHDQIYICVASNPVGKIRSRDVHVRAVISQSYDVRVEDTYATEGNDALLRCVVPDPVKDFVSVTSWIKDSTFNIFPHSGAGGRYFMTPSGELLIEEVSRNDSSSTFRCRTVNRLTGETQLSENSGRLQLSGGSGSKSNSSPPSINSRLSKLDLKEGEVAVLLCLSDGWPSPSHWWLRGNGGYGGFESLRQTERIRIRKSAVIIENVGAKDSGTYVCYANSTSGSDRHKLDVRVTSPLSVQVVPSVLTVDIGKSGEFTCWTNSPDESSQSSSASSTPRQISWRKDGIEIRTSLRLSLTVSGDSLRIANVQREDKGIYQCFVKSGSDMAQASAQLRLGDAAPQLVYRFIEQTLRPGPSVSLKCSAIGNPTPHITWLLDGFALPQQSDRLLIGQYVTLNGDVVSHVNITSTRVEDGGEFQCFATNKLGISTHSARLNIYGAPFVRNMPSPITGVAGKDFRIKCPVAGYPISSITWEKDGQALPLTRRQLVSPDGTLTVKDVDRTKDAGWYNCIASNKQGNSRKGFELDVVVPPKLLPFSFPEETREGSRILVTCSVSEGDGPIRIQWLKNMEVVGDNSEMDLSQSINKIAMSSSSSLARASSDGASDISTYKIADFGALTLQINHVKSHDAANYSCLATNKGGEVSATKQLVIHVAPRIAPFSFPAQVSQGSRVQAVCSVEQGDIEETNLSVKWLKDSEPLSGDRLSMPMPMTGNNIKVVHVDAYSAMLIIDRVDSSHSGNFTCQISNSVETVSQTASLIVRVPPKWIVEPQDAEVSEGSPVVIPCQADGFPTPSVSWKKAMGSRPENYRDIPVQSTGITSTGLSAGSISLQHQPGGTLTVISASSEDTFSFANGTLVIRSGKKVHQGSYLCEASNGIGGTGLSKVIRLRVNVPVHVKEPQQNVSSRVGGKATLRCEIVGDAPILEAGWKRGLTEIKPEIDFRYHIRTLNNSQGIFSELTVSNVGREDTARYVCSAANQHGRSQGAVWLYVQEPPDTPRNLNVISKGSRFVRLAWILTQDGNSPITQFAIKYKEESAGSTNDFQEITVPGQVFSETVGNLRPSTKYLFSVIAENQVGQSEKSVMLEMRTDGEAPEGRSRNVRVAAVSSSDIQVTWEHPEKDTWHGELLGYYVGYKSYREGEQYQFNTVERKEGLQEYQIRGLHAFSSYDIVVQAYNGIGAGPLSEPVVATTLEDVPASSPEGVHCSPLESNGLQLSWNPLSLEQARGLIKGYKVFLERTDFDLLESDKPPLIQTTPSTNLVVSGLAKYNNYSLQIHAYTLAGDGPMSSPIYCHTEEDFPGSPAAIKTVVSSSSSITVAWLPPKEPNGQLTKYTIYISPGVKKKRTVTADVTKFQFEGLQVDEKYEFRVTASNRYGEGGPAFAHKTQTKNVPSAILSFGNEFRIVWKTDARLACDTVGNPILQWTRYSEVVKDSDRPVVARDGSLIIRNARRIDGGNYTCRINGSNGHDTDSITHRLVVQVPPLGPLLNAAVNSHSSINLQWKLSDSGGAPIRGYILHLKAAEEWLERRISRHLTSYELKDLECGTRYQMYLTAYNRAGMGRASETVNVSTFGSSPSLSLAAPQFMVETNRTWARVILRDVWSINGCKIHMFKVFYRELDGSHWQRAVGGDLQGESHSVDLVGLKGGTGYQVKVIATNSAGSSQAEVTINTPTSPGLGAETSNNIMNQPISTPFYLDIKLMIPILLSTVAILVAAGGVCLCLRKKAPLDCRSSDRLSVGTPSSSTYFKQNQRNSQQVYMTVKKSTPLKGGMADVTDLEPIPQYADDIYPYATFELNESRRESKPCTSIPTLDRRRSSGVGHWNPDTIVQEKNRSNSKSKLCRGPMRKDESDEYDSYGSDTDTDRDLQPGMNRLSIHGNMNGVPSRLNSKFQDYDSHTRHGNRYEFAPPQANAMLKYQDKTRQMQNEIHGMVMAEPYFFNDAYPTTDERRGRGGRQTGRRKLQGQITSEQLQNHQLYGTAELAGSVDFHEKVHLDPPYGFKDLSENRNQDKICKDPNLASSKLEYSIAV